jgi:transcription elongation factor Elf1
MGGNIAQTDVGVKASVAWFPTTRYTAFLLVFEALGGRRGMTTITVEEVEARLSSVRCAICKTSEFSVDRRSMQPDGEWKAGCKKCRYSFPVHTDMEFYLRTQPDVPYRLKEITCPACEHRGVSLDFRIVMSVREAIYFVTCNGCKKPFPEWSSLEAFE